MGVCPPLPPRTVGPGRKEQGKKVSKVWDSYRSHLIPKCLQWEKYIAFWVGYNITDVETEI